MTWEFCSCNPNCARMILEKIDLKSNCNLLQNFDFKFEQTSVDCNFLRIKRFYGKDELPVPYNTNFKDEKNILSDIKFTCELYKTYIDVETCIYNFFYDPGYLLEGQKNIIYDFHRLDSKICDQIQFNSEQLKMIQKTDFISPDVVLHFRNKRSYIEPLISKTRNQAKNLHIDKHVNKDDRILYSAISMILIFFLFIYHRYIYANNLKGKLTLLSIIGTIILMCVIVYSNFKCF